MNTVVFDLGNVLVDYNGGVCIDMLGYTGTVKKELINAIFLSDAWKAGDKGSVTPEEQLEQFIGNAPHLEKKFAMYMNIWTDLFTNLIIQRKFLLISETLGLNCIICRIMGSICLKKQSMSWIFLKNLMAESFLIVKS